jgi:hypothetical protein
MVIGLHVPSVHLELSAHVASRSPAVQGAPSARGVVHTPHAPLLFDEQKRLVHCEPNQHGAPGTCVPGLVHEGESPAARSSHDWLRRAETQAMSSSGVRVDPSAKK